MQHKSKPEQFQLKPATTNVSGNQVIPRIIFLSRCQLDLMARDLITGNAPANLVVGADRNCLYRCFFRGTKIAIKNYGFALFIEFMLKECADKCQWSLASLCFTLWFANHGVLCFDLRDTRK